MCIILADARAKICSTTPEFAIFAGKYYQYSYNLFRDYFNYRLANKKALSQRAQRAKREGKSMYCFGYITVTVTVTVTVMSGKSVEIPQECPQEIPQDIP